MLEKRDVNLIASRLPKPLRDFLLKTDLKVWIAGGFIRSVISGEKPNDIDLWTDSKETAEKLAVQIAGHMKGRTHKTDNALTILAKNRIPIQIITRWLFPEPDPLLDSFDFTIAQAAVWYDQVQKSWRGRCNPGFYPDLAARRLIYTHPVRDEEAGGSMLRVRKFVSRGYKIPAESLAGVIARLVCNINMEKVDRLGKSHEEGLTHMITSLLVAVDPSVNIDGEIIEEEGGHEGHG